MATRISRICLSIAVFLGFRCQLWRFSDVKEERPRWSHRFEFYLWITALVFSPISVWKFPLMWTQYGGVACLLPYLVCLLSVGLPLLCLEISLGQFMQRSGPRAWAVVPLFKGVSATSMALVVLKVSTNLILAAWSVCYLYLVLTNQLPSCVTDRTSIRLAIDDMATVNGSEPEAREYSTINETLTTDNLAHPLFRLAHGLNNDQNVTCHKRILEYWKREMVETSSGLSSPGSAVLEVFITTVIISIVCYIIVARDIRWSGKIMYILAPLPLAGCVSIIVWTASSGWSQWRDVYYLLAPDFGKLASPEPWFDSVKMTVLTLGLGHHVIPFLGSYNNLDNNIIKDSWLVCLLTVFAHVIVSVSVCGLLGKVAGVSEGQADPWLLFASVFAELRTFEHYMIMSSLFYIFLILIIISTTIIYVESVVSSLVDLSMKLRRWRLLIATGTVSACFLLTIPMSTQGGIFVFQLVERVTDGGFIIITVVLLECLAIGAVYGGSRFYDNMESMTGRRPHWWMKCCWTYVSPVILLATLVYQEYRIPFFTLGSEVGQFGLGNAVLLLLSVVILLQIVVVAVCVVCGKRGSCMQKLDSALKPELKPHQVPIKWRLEGHWTKFGNRV